MMCDGNALSHARKLIAHVLRPVTFPSEARPEGGAAPSSARFVAQERAWRPQGVNTTILKIY